jgi:integrase
VASPRMAKTSTPGIYKRGGRYVVVYRDPSGKQRKEFAVTLAEARDVKATRTADVRRGEFREFSRVEFADYAAEWIDTYRGRTSRGFGDGSRDDYRGALDREAAPFFGRMRLVEIEPRDLKRFLAYLEQPQPRRHKHPRQGLAVSSVRKTVAPVRALLATAVEEGLLRANPAAGLRIAQQTDEEVDETEDVKALTGEELRLLRDKLPEAWRPFFEFLAQSGLRIGEAIELRWRDVDGEWIDVRRRYYRGAVAKPKGRKTRRVRLSAEAAKALWNLRKESHAGADELVFAAERGGRIIPSNLMSRVLKPAAVEAGLGTWVGKEPKRRADTWVGFHTFRHTAATLLFLNGWNAKQVQRFLGHADPGFTLRTYVHLLPEDLPEPPSLAQIMGNMRATRPSENTREVVAGGDEETAANSDVPRLPEVAVAHS